MLSNHCLNDVYLGGLVNYNGEKTLEFDYLGFSFWLHTSILTSDYFNLASFPQWGYYYPHLIGLVGGLNEEMCEVPRTVSSAKLSAGYCLLLLQFYC